jgi:hypothetical protein
MTTDRRSADSTSHVDDVLTEIEGLSKTAERDLHSLGIRGFADLAKYTPKELAKKLYERTKSRRYSVTFIENRDWIGQAKQKLAERKRATSSSPRADTLAKPNAQASGIKLDDWNLHAEFTLYFENKAFGRDEKTWQTRVWKTLVRDRECDNEETFDGIEPHLWVNWILQQAELPVDVASDLIAPKTFVSPTTVTPNPAQVSILNVQINPQSSSDARNGKFASVISFTVSGANARTLAADNTPYQIIVHAVDSDSGVTKHVASERSQLQPKQAVHSHRLKLPIPDLRRFELQTIVLIQSQPELMAVYRGPIINVAP